VRAAERDLEESGKTVISTQSAVAHFRLAPELFGDPEGELRFREHARFVPVAVPLLATESYALRRLVADPIN
jgi:hypothetical protein